MSRRQTTSVPARRRIELAINYPLAMLALHLARLTGTIALGVGLLLFGPDLWRMFNVYLVGTWRRINRESERLRVDQSSPHRATYDACPLIVLATAAVSLTAIRYFGSGRELPKLAKHLSVELPERYRELTKLAYWSLFRLLAYTGVPWLVLRLRRRKRLRDCGLRVRGILKHLRTYLLLYLIVLPPLIVASYTKPFLRTYPFYGLASRSWADLLAWEML